MNASGVVLAIAGAWVLTQILGGNAMGRLGIMGSSGDSGSGGALDKITPKPADPKDEKSKPFGFHDPYGLGL